MAIIAHNKEMSNIDSIKKVSKIACIKEVSKIACTKEVYVENSLYKRSVEK